MLLSVLVAPAGAQTPAPVPVLNVTAGSLVAPAPPGPNASERKPGDYALTVDSLPQPDAPKGRLEGPFQFKSRIIAGTVRRYWLFVPAQYTPEKPASVLVFQDGSAPPTQKGRCGCPRCSRI